jgi:FHS family glucose/mannose:H+ symporter-like MFS transporter
MTKAPKLMGSAEVHFSRMALIASLITFVLIGALSAALGSLLPLLQLRFGVSLVAASTVVSAFWVGAVCGGFGALLGFEILSGGTLMACALAALGGGALGVAASHQWALLLASMVCLGLGFGALDSGLNQLMTRTEPRRRAARLTLLNAAYPIGAVLGPVIVTALGIGLLAWGYLVIGLLSLLLAVSIRDMIAAPTRHSDPKQGLAITSTRFVAAGRIFVGLLAVAYVLYVGLEVNVNAWMASALLSVGHSAKFAAGVNAGFWAAVALSRLAVGALMPRLNPALVVILSCTAAVLILPFTRMTTLAPAAYIATGLAIAPIYPAGLLWLSAARPRRPRDLSTLLAGSLDVLRCSRMDWETPPDQSNMNEVFRADTGGEEKTTPAQSRWTN